MPEPENIAIEIPVAAEIRAVAGRLRMPYEHVRGIVANSLRPVLLSLAEGKVSAIVLRHIEDELALPRIPVKLGVGSVLVGSSANPGPGSTSSSHSSPIHPDFEA